MKVQLHEIYDSRFIPQEHPPGPLIDALNLSINGIAGHNRRWIGTDTVESIYAIGFTFIDFRFFDVIDPSVFDR